jgi:predicted dehydrogenase
MTGQLRVAVLGFWFIHADLFCGEARRAEGVELVAGWDDDIERGQSKAAEYGIDFVPSAEALLSRADVDAVCIAAHPARRAELAELAAAHGKHILVEKPMSTTLADAARIVQAVEQSGVQLMPAFTLRSSPAARYVKTLVDAGELGTIGRVRLMHAQFAASEAANFDGLALAAQEGWVDPEGEGRSSLLFVASHSALWFQWLFGTPASVMSMTNTMSRDLPVEDSAASLLRYAASDRPGMDRGFVAIMDVSTGHSASTVLAEIYGTEGVLVQHRPNLPTTRAWNPVGTPVGVFRRGSKAWEYPEFPPEFRRHEPAYTLYGDFFSSVRSGTTTPVDVYDGYNSIATLVAARRSELEGIEVSVQAWPAAAEPSAT